MVSNLHSSVRFEDVMRTRIVRNFVASYLSNEITVDFDNQLLSSIPVSIRDKRFKNFEILVKTYAGIRKATEEQRLDAEKALYEMIVTLRLEDRIEGFARIDIDIETRLTNLEEESKRIERWFERTGEQLS